MNSILPRMLSDIATKGHAKHAGHTTCKGERVRGRQGKTPCDLHIDYSIAVGNNGYRR